MTGIRGLCLSRRKEQVSHLREKVPFGWTFLFLENLSLLYRSLLQKKSLLKRPAGTSISLKDRRAAPALGSRFLRSYVPLRCAPNESESARDMDVPAHVSQIHFSVSNYITKTDFTAGSLFSGSRCPPGSPEAAAKSFRRTISPVFPPRSLHPVWKDNKQ